MKRKSQAVTWTLAILLGVATVSPAQRADSSDFDRRSIVDAVLDVFDERYFDPDMAEKMTAHVRAKMDRQEYDQLASLDSFTEQLTDDLRSVSHDGHIIVYRIRSETYFKANDDRLTDQDIARHSRDNFGFLEVKRLTGNIGYIRIDSFDYPEIAGPTATAALSFIANCDAVIFDVRQNSGGKETMVQFLLSHLFEQEIHFLDVYDRNRDIIKQSWTLPYVPGPKLFDTPVYVVTSNHTGSAAEAFAYHLKSYDRAIIVGETTKGIAHWIDIVDFPDHKLRVHVPYGRPENPVTGTNWEQEGVVPDIESPAPQALGAAHMEAMKQLIEASADDDTRRQLLWDMDAVVADVEPIQWNRKTMLPYTGVYADGKYSIVISGDQLYWRYGPEVDYVLLPLREDLFAFDDTDDLRFRFTRGKENGITGFQLLYSNGDVGGVSSRTGDIE